MSQTAGFFGVSIDDLCGTSRTRGLVTARQIAMYLCRESPTCRCPRSAQFGGRTTPRSCMPTARSALMAERVIYNQVTELTNRIKQQARSG